MALLLLILVTTACNQNKYHVIERKDVYVAESNDPVPTPKHDEVHFVLMHGKHKIFAICDLSSIDHLDTKASCGLRPLRDYRCVLGSDDFYKAKGPLSDLNCTDDNGRPVYLYVSKEE